MSYLRKERFARSFLFSLIDSLCYHQLLCVTVAFFINQRYQVNAICEVRNIYVLLR
jgi:hypothetical protein